MKNEGKIAIGTFILGFVAGAGLYWLSLVREVLPLPLIDTAIKNEIVAIAKEDTREGIRNESVADRSSQKKSTVSVEKAFSPSLAVSLDGFVVSDQGSGKIVVLSEVFLTTNGWVAVHETEEGETTGRILGARRLDAGDYQGESIELLRPTEAGRLYVVVLHRDDGDTAFDYTKELPVYDAAGKLILEEFTALNRN